MFNEKLFNDVKVVLFKNTIYEYDAPEVIAQLEGVIGSECFDIETTLSEVTYIFDGFVVEIDYENCKLTKLIIDINYGIEPHNYLNYYNETAI